VLGIVRGPVVTNNVVGATVLGIVRGTVVTNMVVE